MITAHIPGSTRTIGKQQGYGGLPIRDEIVNCSVNGEVPAMTTVWEPTPDELERIAAGARVEVTILGTVHPPIVVNVGDVG